MKRTYKKTTYYAGKINKYVREWVKKLQDQVMFDETKVDQYGNTHRMIIKNGDDFHLKGTIQYDN